LALVAYVDSRGRFSTGERHTFAPVTELLACQFCLAAVRGLAEPKTGLVVAIRVGVVVVLDYKNLITQARVFERESTADEVEELTYSPRTEVRVGRAIEGAAELLSCLAFPIWAADRCDTLLALATDCTAC
jgi:hypothetical protein